MSKSILVIDAPEVCIDCPCHFAGMSGQVWCGKENKELLSDDIETFKPDWCPIRNLPRRKMLLGLDGASNAMEIRARGMQEGFNACIDEILKGANGNE